MLSRPIGIMSAMPQEADLIQKEIRDPEVIHVGKRQFIRGTFHGEPVVFCLAGIGKVSAATTAALLIEKFHVFEIIFTGVAGGGKGTMVGDIVVGRTYLQHDLDPRPIFPQFYIFSLDKQTLHADEVRVARMVEAARAYVAKMVPHAKVHTGVIVSGDQFVSGSMHHDIAERTEELLSDGFHAIEMEGAAVAQVCHELGVPFVVVRAISDKADGTAPVDFALFLDKVAAPYSLGVLNEYFKKIIVF